jgi:hypothetical protein
MNTMDIPEQRLVLRAQAGDAVAFDQLLRRYEQPLYRHITRMLHDEQASYEALQETYLAIVRSIRKLRSRSSFRPWAYGPMAWRPACASRAAARQPGATRPPSCSSSPRICARCPTRSTTALFWIAGCCEALFGLGMLYCMDWHDRFHWFLLCGFLMVYMPLVLMTWRNSVKMDHLYYRLVDELKFED